MLIGFFAFDQVLLKISCPKLRNKQIQVCVSGFFLLWILRCWCLGRCGPFPPSAPSQQSLPAPSPRGLPAWTPQGFPPGPRTRLQHWCCVRGPCTRPDCGGRAHRLCTWVWLRQDSRVSHGSVLRTLEPRALQGSAQVRAGHPARGRLQALGGREAAPRPRTHRPARRKHGSHAGPRPPAAGVGVSSHHASSRGVSGLCGHRCRAQVPAGCRLPARGRGKTGQQGEGEWEPGTAFGSATRSPDFGRRYTESGIHDSESTGDRRGGGTAASGVPGHAHNWNAGWCVRKPALTPIIKTF